MYASVDLIDLTASERNQGIRIIPVVADGPSGIAQDSDSSCCLHALFRSNSKSNTTSARFHQASLITRIGLQMIQRKTKMVQ